MLIFKNRIVVTFTLGVQLYRTWVVVKGFKKKKKKKLFKNRDKLLSWTKGTK